MRNSIISLGMASILCLSAIDIYAQETLSFKNNIQGIKIEPLTGNVFVRTKDGISSINPQSSKVDWMLDTQKVNNATELSMVSKTYESIANNNLINAFSKNADIQFIPDSPFVQIKLDNNTVIANSINGEIIFNAAQYGYVIYSTSYIPLKKQLLVLGQKDKNIDFINFDLSDKKINWKSNVGNLDSLTKEFGSFIKGFFKDETSAAENKIVVNEGTIYAGIKNLLFALDATSGNIKWKTLYPINNFYISGNGDRVVVILNAGNVLTPKQKLNILDASNGNKIWKEDITTKYIAYIEDRKDKVLIALQSGLNLYDYTTGNKLWKNDAEGKDIKNVVAVDDGYLYIANKEMNFVNQNGQNKWKKYLEISDKSVDEVYYLGTVSNNRVFYMTDSYGNLVDYTSGKKVWNDNIEFKKSSPLVYDNKGSQFLVYNNQQVFSFDANSDNRPQPKEKIDMKNDNTIRNIESFDWGTCIVGQNDVIGIDNEGKTIYHNSYKEPGEAIRRIFKTGQFLEESILNPQSLITKSISSSKFVYADNKKSSEQKSSLTSEQKMNKLSREANLYKDFSNILTNNLLGILTQRFDGLKQSNNYAFVLNRGANGPELIKVRKKDGVEVVKIDLDSNKPIYEIDGITDNIYYASGKDLKIFK